MLKVIAEDFIHPDAVDTVLPLYRELVACTQREPLCLGYELFVDQKDPGHFVFIEQWPNAPPWTSTAPANISSGWCRRSMPSSARHAGSC